MWSFYEDLERESRERGLKAGQEIGRKIGQEIGEEIGKKIGEAKQIVEIGNEIGWSADVILQRMQTKLDISQNQAEEYFRIYGK